MGNYLFICSFLVFKLLHFLLSFFIKLGSICRCQHYRRRCRIRAPCCNEIFDCRHCHNEAKVSKCLILFYFLSDNICYIFLIYGCCLNDMVPSYFIFKSQSFLSPIVTVILWLRAALTMCIYEQQCCQSWVV
jgi:hypothetical protein